MLEQNLSIVEEKDGTLCSDVSVERFLRQLMQAKNRIPPRIYTTSPPPLVIPIAPEDVLDRLVDIESLEDLLSWVLDALDEIDFDSAIRLFHAIIEKSPDYAQSTNERLDYDHRDFVINAARWTWKGRANGNQTTSSIDGQPTGKTRRGIPVA
jgi:hypothetical protein